MLPDPRSGSGLRRCRHAPIASHGHPRQAYCSTLALGERLRRKADRVDPTRVCRPRDRVGEAHLRRILQAYAGYYNDVRTHRSLDKDAPFSRPVQRIGRVTSHALLGGLHHRYCRILIIAVGFNWAGYGFGWTLRGTAEQKAKDAGEAAIVRVLAPICADKFRQASDSSFRYTQPIYDATAFGNINTGRATQWKKTN